MSRIATASRSIHLGAAALAVFFTGAQLSVIEALAQQRQVSAHAQVVQLDRVVVTGQRASSQAAATRPIAACQPIEGATC